MQQTENSCGRQSIYETRVTPRFYISPFTEKPFLFSLREFNLQTRSCVTSLKCFNATCSPFWNRVSEETLGSLLFIQYLQCNLCAAITFIIQEAPSEMFYDPWVLETCWQLICNVQNKSELKRKQRKLVVNQETSGSARRLFQMYRASPTLQTLHEMKSLLDLSGTVHFLFFTSWSWGFWTIRQETAELDQPPTFQWRSFTAEYILHDVRPLTMCEETKEEETLEMKWWGWERELWILSVRIYRVM